jgi:hypothetical protein
MKPKSKQRQKFEGKLPPNMKLADDGKTIIVEKKRPGQKGNGGRPESMTLRRTREVQNRIAAEVKTLPLDVMIENMLFYHQEANALFSQIRELVGEGALEDDQGNGLGDLLKDMMRLRERAQGCAVDAAPYIHHRLASILHKPDDKPFQVEMIRRVIIDPRNPDAKGLPSAPSPEEV